MTATDSGGTKNEQWYIDATYDLCHCSDCVDAYYHALEQAFSEDPSFNGLEERVYKSNVARLENCLESVLSKCHESGEYSDELSEEDMMTFWSTQQSIGIQREFECPLIEILKYPRLLLDRQVNNLFVKALNELETIEQQLEVTSKHPGLYLLLVHQNPKVLLL